MTTDHLQPGLPLAAPPQERRDPRKLEDAIRANFRFLGTKGSQVQILSPRIINRPSLGGFPGDGRCVSGLRSAFRGALSRARDTAAGAMDDRHAATLFCMDPGVEPCVSLARSFQFAQAWRRGGRAGRD